MLAKDIICCLDLAFLVTFPAVVWNMTSQTILLTLYQIFRSTLVTDSIPLYNSDVKIRGKFVFSFKIFACMFCMLRLFIDVLKQQSIPPFFAV